jgi:hypothetical protein
VVELEVLTRNRLLATVPEQELDILAPEFELVSLGLKQHVYREDEPIEHVTFSTSGVVVADLANGRRPRGRTPS